MSEDAVVFAELNGSSAAETLIQIARQHARDGRVQSLCVRPLRSEERETASPPLDLVERELIADWSASQVTLSVLVELPWGGPTLIDFTSAGSEFRRGCEHCASGITQSVSSKVLEPNLELPAWVWDDPELAALISVHVEQVKTRMLLELIPATQAARRHGLQSVVMGMEQGLVRPKLENALGGWFAGADNLGLPFSTQEVETALDLLASSSLPDPRVLDALEYMGGLREGYIAYGVRRLVRRRSMVRVLHGTYGGWCLPTPVVSVTEELRQLLGGS